MIDDAFWGLVINAGVAAVGIASNAVVYWLGKRANRRQLERFRQRLEQS